jgi:SAM-dependent methyltransferase
VARERAGIAREGREMAKFWEEAEYLPIPELSPYVTHERYERPKEVFKLVAKRLAELTEAGRRYRYADIACANGELLYLLKRRFPHWTLEGFDFTPEFIACGRDFPGLDGVKLHVQDLFTLDDRFDAVSFLGMLHGVWEFEPYLEKLLSLVSPGGLLLVDGCFNPFDIELRAVFMDNSKPEAAGKWRRDFSQHSRSALARFLAGRCRDFTFEDVPMAVEIPRRPDAPHANVWTFRDEHGRVLVTNGTNMLLNKTLMIVRV